MFRRDPQHSWRALFCHPLPSFWPWIKNEDSKKPHSFCQSQNWNYKVSAKVETQSGLLTKILSILDTGVRPSFVQWDVLYVSLNNWIRHGHPSDSRDANKRSLKIFTTMNHTVQLASYSGRVRFFVCISLMSAVTLEADFCDKYAQAIHPSYRVVQLEDGATKQVLRSGLQAQQL